MQGKGRIIIFTGNGKGKTTAALGTAFRTLGYANNVCVIQFLKGKGDYGERLFAEKLENLEWHVCGKGFVFKKTDISKDMEVAEEGFLLAEQKIMSGEFDLVILDEITYLPLYNFLDVERIVSLLERKPDNVNVILTGRDADSRLVEVADTVTRMDEIKHAYKQGVKAQIGIEF